MQKLVHPDVYFLMPVAKSDKVKQASPLTADFLPLWRLFCTNMPYGNLADWQKHAGITGDPAIKVAQARNMTADLQLKPYEANSKTVIVWLPELMNAPAANATLKILEEPPTQTRFVLVNQNHETLLPTILSRVQRMRILPFADAEIEEHLTQHGTPAAQAQTIALLAEGNMRKALDLKSEPENNFAELFAQWMRMAYTRKFDELIKLGDTFNKLGREPQKLFLDYALTILHQAGTYAFRGPEHVRLREKDKTFAANFSKVLSPDLLHAVTTHISQYHYYLQRNANPKISFTALSIKIAQAFAYK